ncbi:MULTISPECIES: hypothetical protein [Aeromonas]|uniref:hypothetical protein n=1 Tax=Aeromonas TaxID=642 RepID=UPI002B05D793|nr:hypothetical protein [Aeromonas jandaei]
MLITETAAGAPTDDNVVMKNLAYVSHALVMSPDHLTPMAVSNIPETEFAWLRSRVMPGFCYDNAWLTANHLGAAGVVLGAALVNIGGHQIPVEHAWVWDGGDRYYDPTYQLLDEAHQGRLNATSYYGLIRLSMDEYLAFAEECSNPLPNLIAVDVVQFRRHPRFSHLFKRCSVNRKHVPEDSKRGT